jgi:hypothetical protein
MTARPVVDGRTPYPLLRRTRSLSGGLVAAVLLLAGCGQEEAASADGGGDTIEAGDGVPDVPEECRAAFPLTFGGGDLAAVELLPGEWPDPPAGATLCGTGGTGGDQEYVEYAVDLGPEEVLAHYEGALPGAYAPARTETGRGPALTGVADGVTFLVEPRDGGLQLVFQKQDA